MAKLTKSAIFGIVCLLIATACIEVVAWLWIPRWPAYMLRPGPVPVAAIEQWQAGMADVTFALNSWQMRDRERSIAKPPGVSFRSIFIGDSVLDGSFSRSSVPARVEALLTAAGHHEIEAINLGVTSTSPVEYYYRLERVGLKLSPDAVVMLLFAGNDFLYRKFGDEAVSGPLVAELPQPSIIGNVLPHTTWLARRLLNLASPLEGEALPDEQSTVDAAIGLPSDARLRVISRYMREHYFPALGQARIEEILSRGGDTFWTAFQPRLLDREFLPSGFIRQMISSETGPPPPPVGEDRQEVSATLSWIVAADALAKAHGVRFAVAIAPVPMVDPDFVAFWRPWPGYNSYNVQRDADHKALVAALADTSVAVIDLRDDLAGVPSAYRKSDMHWTEHGNDIVAARFARELPKLRP